MRNKNLYKREI